VAVGEENLRQPEALKTSRSQAAGRAAQSQRQQALHASRKAELELDLVLPAAPTFAMSPGPASTAVNSHRRIAPHLMVP
jgi:hypothetical protein